MEPQPFKLQAVPFLYSSNKRRKTIELRAAEENFSLLTGLPNPLRATSHQPSMLPILPSYSDHSLKLYKLEDIKREAFSHSFLLCPVSPGKLSAGSVHLRHMQTQPRI